MTTAVEDGRLKLVYGKDEIKEYYGEEIFTRNNLKPFVMVADSNGGKTTISVDIYRVCLEAGFNQFNFVTTTFNSEENSYLRNNILEASVIQQEEKGGKVVGIIEKTIKLVDALQDEQRANPNDEQCKLAAIQQMDSLDKDQLTIYKKQVLEKMRQVYDFDFLSKSVCCNNENCYNLIIVIQQNSNSPDEYMQNLNMMKDKILSFIEDQKNYEITYKDIQRTRLYFINDWQNKVRKLFEDYEKNILGFSKMVLRKKVGAELQKNNGLLQEWLMNGQCSSKIINDYAPLIQDKRRVCLIMDDVSHIINNANKKNKITYQGQQIPEGDAFKNVINRIFNQGRHLGTIFLGIHSAGTLDAQAAQLASNVILTTTSSLGKTTSLWVTGNRYKTTIQQMLIDIKKYNDKNQTYYVLVCFKEQDQSPDKKSNFCLYQAKYQNASPYNLGIYQNSAYYYKLSEKQLRKQFVNANEIIQQIKNENKQIKSIEDMLPNKNDSSDSDSDSSYEESSEDES